MAHEEVVTESRKQVTNDFADSGEGVGVGPLGDRHPPHCSHLGTPDPAYSANAFKFRRQGLAIHIAAIGFG
jgi:hypothetical protein